MTQLPTMSWLIDLKRWELNMKFNRDLIIKMLDEAILDAADSRAPERVSGELLAYKTHLEIHYKDADKISMPETIVNLLTRILG